jgi:hypothetical protein
VNQNAPQFFWEAVNKTSSKKTGYVGSLRANRSDVAGRFIVGQMDLPIANNCTVANANFTVLYYNTTTTRKFRECGIVILINTNVLLTNVSVKCSRMKIMHGGFKRR